MSEDLYKCANRRCGHIYQHSETVWVADPRPGPKTLLTKLGTCPACGHGSFFRLKPLFVPLKREYFEAFERGEKTTEYRPYGPRWNERTCRVGRRVVLSLGYGDRHRLTGKVVSFEKSREPLKTLAWLKCYGHRTGDCACIGITLDITPPATEKAEI